MAKMTSAQLATFTASYVDAQKQGGAWNATTNNFVGMLDKVGKQVTLAGSYQDKLPELEGDELPLGKTIEEYFIDLTLPEAFTGVNNTEGEKDYKPALPSVEAVSYCYTLGRKKIKTTEPMGNVERACISSEVAGNVTGSIMERLANSMSLTRYACKKQLLGNAGDKAVAAGLVEQVAVPVSDVTGEAFIEQVKKDAEDASFAHEGGLNGALIGAAPSLTLFVKKGVMPVIQVQTLAGAFNRDELAIPAKIKVVDDFGTQTNSDVYAILVDDRAIKLHSGYRAVRTSENADGDFMNIVEHFEDTGFISKYAYIKAYKA